MSANRLLHALVLRNRPNAFELVYRANSRLGLHGLDPDRPLPSASRGRARQKDRFMESPTEKQILNRAYEIWERNGRPEGREDEFWHQAEQELRAEEERGDPGKGTPDDI